MKYINLMGCMVMAVMGTGQLMAAAPSVQKEWQGHQTISLLNLSEREIQDFSQGNLGDSILECPQGACLPFKITLKGEFLSLEPESAAPLYLRVLKSCYIRCEEKENFLFSTDLQKWEGFSEFFTGNLKVAVHEEHNGMPVAELELELNQRKSTKLLLK